MNVKVPISLLVAAAMLAGCATRANSVAPVAVSANDYTSYTCASARAELQLAREKQNALTRRQNNAAVADAAGVFLFLVPAGSIFGADVAGELAQAKGEVLALERHIRGRCEGGAALSEPSQPAAAAPAVLTSAPAPAPAPSPKNCGIRSTTNPDAVSC